MKIAKLISTLFYSGLSPIAPGTCGSLLALIFIFPLAFLPQSISLVFLFFITSAILGFVFIPRYLQGRVADLQEIVIDEAAGLYLTIFLAMVFLRFFAVKANIFFIFGLSFIFFRIFDITKPLIIGYFDRTLKGAAGIMVDDLLAGVFAGVCVTLLLTIFYNFFHYIQ